MSATTRPVRQGQNRQRQRSAAIASPRSPRRDSASLPAGPLRPRRQPRWIALGILLACLGGLGSVLLYQQSSITQNVAVVANAVSRGEVIQEGDLGVRQVGALTGVAVVPADQVTGLVGQHALVDLSPGLLPINSVGQLALPTNRVQLGLKLPSGRLPAGPLPSGSLVQLIEVSAPGEREEPAGSEAKTEPPTAGATVINAVVLSSPTLGIDQASWVLDVHVAALDAEEVAVLAAADRVVLVKVSS